MSYRPARSGAEGNTRLLKSYGAGSTGPRQHYATGGAVKGAGNPSLDEGLSAAGSPAKPSLARPGRKMPGKGAAGKKGGKTNVNVVIMQKPDAPAGDKPMPPMPAGAGAGPMPLPPDAGGGPPMPMRAKGGRVNRADGGPAEDSGEVSNAEQRKYLRKKASSERGKAALSGALATGAGIASVLPYRGKILRAFNMGNTALQGADTVEALSKAKKADEEADKFEDRKSGGRVKHHRASGGRIPKMDAGAGGGTGRLEKAKAYGTIALPKKS